MKKKHIYIVTIVIGIMMLGFSFFSYLEEEPQEDRRPIPKKITIIKNIPQAPEFIKEKSKVIRVEDIFQIEEIPSVAQEVKISDAQKTKSVEDEIKRNLELRMNEIYTECKDIKTKEGILSRLQKKEYKDLFLSDLYGNTHYGVNNIKDVNARTIPLEQIQKVGKYGEGFIVSTIDVKGTKRYIYVKALDVGKLFLGVEFYTSAI